MQDYNIIEKTFKFSVSMIELYVLLLKNEEFEISEKILKSGLLIRDKAQEACSALSIQEKHAYLIEAYHNAVQVRYWLKMLQMKYLVNHGCDDCVEKINEIINIMNVLNRKYGQFNINLQYQLN
ncbi:MAG: four helix bundle protein [Cytophagaceae bacterium]|nr:four helix bundle protein [Cytophagaceae bacterium]MDW8455422.1 four helix bundle protein [Cytophagaceae bacterium]